MQLNARPRACKVGIGMPRQYSMDNRSQVSAATRARPSAASTPCRSGWRADHADGRRHRRYRARTVYNHFPSKEVLVAAAYSAWPTPRSRCDLRLRERAGANRRFLIASTTRSTSRVRRRRILGVTGARVRRAAERRPHVAPQGAHDDPARGRTRRLLQLPLKQAVAVCSGRRATWHC